MKKSELLPAAIPAGAHEACDVPISARAGF